jgi:hypothetical protein
MAGEALVGVEAGAETVVGALGDGFDVGEAGETVLEEGGFVGGEVLEGRAGAGGTAADAGVYCGGFGCGLVSGLGLSMAGRVDGGCQGQGDESAKSFERNPLEFPHDLSLEGPKNRGILHPSFGVGNLGVISCKALLLTAFVRKKILTVPPFGLE